MRGIGRQRVRLKYCAYIEMGQSPPSSEYSDSPEDGLPFLQGTADFGSVNPSPHVYCGLPTKVARAGDILFSVRAPVGEMNVADQEYGIGRGLCAVRPHQNLNPRFAWWALSEARHQLNFASTGSTYEAVATEDVGNVSVQIAGPDEQRTIANYLDSEMLRLDALIEAKERMRELLSEKRRAIITRGVTRGLDPRASLCSSGLHWLDAIPSHWETKRAKWLFSERDERSETGGEVLLSLRMERGLVPHNDVSVKETRPEDLIGYKRVSIGEIVLNRMRASSGLVAVASQDGLVSPDYAVFVPSPEVEAEYFTHLFKTELLQRVFRSESTGLGTGSSGFLRLYSESFLALWMPYPPLEEQVAIVKSIEQQTSAIDSLRIATERTIALLKERRAALISNVVSGQLQIT